MKQLILGTVAALSLTTAATANTYVYTIDEVNGGFDSVKLNDFSWPSISGCSKKYVGSASNENNYTGNCNSKYYYNGVGYNTSKEAVAAGAADLEAAGEALALAAMGGMEGPTEAEANEAEEINDAQANTDGADGADGADPVELDVSTIVSPLTEDSPTLSANILSSKTLLEEEYGVAKGEEIIDHILNTSVTNSAVRLDQLKEWDAFTTDGITIDIDNFDDYIEYEANELTASINAYQYQVQQDTDQKRIRLLNEDGSAATDYIQTDNITDLIVNLSKETFNQGFADGFDLGFQSGYAHGYADGFIDGVNSVMEPIE